MDLNVIPRCKYPANSNYNQLVTLGFKLDPNIGAALRPVHWLSLLALCCIGKYFDITSSVVSIWQLYIAGTLNPCVSLPDAEGYSSWKRRTRLWENVDTWRAENGLVSSHQKCIWLVSDFFFLHKMWLMLWQKVWVWCFCKRSHKFQLMKKVITKIGRQAGPQRTFVFHLWMSLGSSIRLTPTTTTTYPFSLSFL